MTDVILGPRGMLGAAMCRRLPAAVPIQVADLTQYDVTWAALKDCAGADRLWICAARVGGIGRNVAEPFEMLRDNLLIQINAIDAAAALGIRQVILFGSSCIYPRSQSPGDRWEESDLFSGGELEGTNRAYALAKLAGIEMMRHRFPASFVPIPCNLYGPGDHFEPHRSHVMAALVKKFCDAVDNRETVVKVGGTGRPRREFLHVDDLADVVVRLSEAGAWGCFNIGPPQEVAISWLASMIAEEAGFTGRIEYDSSIPDGVMSKRMDCDRLRIATRWDGGRPLKQGIAEMIQIYRGLKK